MSIKEGIEINPIGQNLLYKNLNKTLIVTFPDGKQKNLNLDECVNLFFQDKIPFEFSSGIGILTIKIKDLEYSVYRDNFEVEFYILEFLFEVNMKRNTTYIKDYSNMTLYFFDYFPGEIEKYYFFVVYEESIIGNLPLSIDFGEDITQYFQSSLNQEDIPLHKFIRDEQGKEARAKYWYKRFYKETYTGKIYRLMKGWIVYYMDDELDTQVNSIHGTLHGLSSDIRLFSGIIIILLIGILIRSFYIFS